VQVAGARATGLPDDAELLARADAIADLDARAAAQVRGGSPAAIRDTASAGPPRR
jgi:hypothetical protein